MLFKRDSISGSTHGGSVLNGGDYIRASAAASATNSSSSAAVVTAAAAVVKPPLSAVRIVVLGGSGVGKSCLVQRLLQGKGGEVWS